MTHLGNHGNKPATSYLSSHHSIVQFLTNLENWCHQALNISWERCRLTVFIASNYFRVLGTVQGYLMMTLAEKQETMLGSYVWFLLHVP